MKSKWIKRVLKWLGIAVLLYFIYTIYLTWFRPVRMDGISLTSLTGQALAFDSLVQGKHTVLNFWATWCKPCIEEMPMLDSVYQSLDKEKWQIFLISDEPVEKIREFQSRQSLTMPFLKLEGTLSEIGISALPKTLVIDEHKNVLDTKTGGLTMGAGEFLEMVENYE